MKKAYWRVGVLMVCIFFCSWGIAGATDGEEFLPAYAGPEEPAEISPLRVVTQLIFSLALVIALFYLVARFLKARWGSAMEAKYLAVMDRLSLGANRDIYILRIGSQFLSWGSPVIAFPSWRGLTIDLLLALQEQGKGKGLCQVLASQRQGVFTLSILEAQLEGLKKRENRIQTCSKGRSNSR